MVCTDPRDNLRSSPTSRRNRACKNNQVTVIVTSDRKKTDNDALTSRNEINVLIKVIYYTALLVFLYRERVDERIMSLQFSEYYSGTSRKKKIFLLCKRTPLQMPTIQFVFNRVISLFTYCHNHLLFIEIFVACNNIKRCRL